MTKQNYRKKLIKKESCESVFFYNSLPDLPAVSNKFLQFLQTLPRGNTANQKKLTHKSHKKRTNLNAFMAFRAYYSRFVLETSAQALLSRKLAEFWFSETNRDIWEIYASEYCRRKEDLSFVNWLQKELKIEENFPNHPQKCDTESELSIFGNKISCKLDCKPPGTMEDVFANGTTEQSICAKRRDGTENEVYDINDPTTARSFESAFYYFT